MDKTNEIKRKLYLIRLNIFNFDMFYGSILLNMHFEIFDDDAKEDIRIENNVVYISKHYIECGSIPYISNIIIEKMKKYVEDILSSMYINEKLYNHKGIVRDNDDEIVFHWLDSINFKTNVPEIDVKESSANIRLAIKTMNRSGLMHLLPGSIKKLIETRKVNKIDWKNILRQYLLVENSDYSFCPPDRRIEGDFFLPDFNVNEEKLEKVIFMIDVSSSMKEEKVEDIFSEVKNIYNQFKGKIEIYIGFFDAKVNIIKKCENIEDMETMKPATGGTTSFIDIFDKVDTDFNSDDIKLLVIITDGMGIFPNNGYRPNVPVLWMLTDFEVKVPFGDVCMYTSEKDYNVR